MMYADACCARHTGDKNIVALRINEVAERGTLQGTFELDSVSGLHVPDSGTHGRSDSRITESYFIHGVMQS